MIINMKTKYTRTDQSPSKTLTITLIWSRVKTIKVQALFNPQEQLLKDHLLNTNILYKINKSSAMVKLTRKIRSPSLRDPTAINLTFKVLQIVRGTEI
jgi:hypothetical protein